MQIRLMTPVGTSVLVVERDRPRAEATKRLLVEQGYSVTGLLTDMSRFAEAAAQTTADAIMIYATEPDGELLDALRALPTEQRRPTILITEDGSTDAIHQAVAAGVNACVVVGVNGNRIRSAIDLAKANFSNTRGLRERALDEDAAYTLLRTRAMQRGVRLVAVAEMVVEAAEVMQL